LSILNRVDLTTNELNKYTFWDAEKPYTRNLVATDNVHYTLLLLCWSPGKESKIHNHPCNGCYVKTVRGCIRECQYVGDDSSNLSLTKTRFFNEGQISYINDSIGYHKIGNPFRDSGSVSLHLYTPPFHSCKVWVEGMDGGTWEDAKMGLFSVMGHRSPHLEGRPGLHSRLILEIRDFFKGSQGLSSLTGVKRPLEG
jgi:cysteine dioxygenase